jgi:hypothetical protein
MKRLSFFFSLCLLFGAAIAQAQSTGNSFMTPAGQVTGGSMMLVPCGPTANGQPTACPPGPANGVPVLCTNCSPSAPTGAPTNSVNGTIAVTDAFQSLLALNPARKGCQFQNQGTRVQYYTTAPSPTEAAAFQVPPGALYNCVSPGSNVVSTDQVWVTGTSGDAFAGSWQ